MDFRQFLQENIVYLDGGMGTQLLQKGLAPGAQPEGWNIAHPEVITAIHKAYYDAGSHVVSTNTFGANRLKFSPEELEAIVAAAVANARAAQAQTTGTQPTFVALDIGPTGQLLKPLGMLDFEEAVEVFAATVRLGVRYGVDLILIETMSDCYETKAALLAAKENSTLPVLVSNAYGESGKLMTGASPAAMVAMLEGMGADAVGANCSLGPRRLRGVVEELLCCASVPVLLKPNAGLPRAEDGHTVYDVSPEEYAAEMADLIGQGVRVAGGCCGTTPAYIRALTQQTAHLSPTPLTRKERTVVSSYNHAVLFGDGPVLIGERINPTGRPNIRQALLQQDVFTLQDEGISQQCEGVHLLDVHVALPELDEVQTLADTVSSLQEVVSLPLQIDTADPAAMEAALRRYNGKALINSVSGKQASMDALFPLAKKYGGVIVALTLDEDGIPATAEGRLAIAEKILRTASTYGIDKKDVVFDTLTLSVGADPSAAHTTLEALSRVREELGCHTLLGVSNVSYGLPNRDAVNGAFLALALDRGLSAAIINPFSAPVMEAYNAYRDGGSAHAADAFTATLECARTQLTPAEGSPLYEAIVHGQKRQAADLTQERLAAVPPLTIVQEDIIPALNRVGESFSDKQTFLPQLILSAEAARSAFLCIRNAMDNPTDAARDTVVLATVQGDIHDIGKNIVKLLMENYGFAVVDLGRDVAPETVVQAALEHGAFLVGLSALTTATLPAMAETVRLLKEKAPACKTMVGGAVLTPEYAASIGADRYAKDALEAVRYAESLIE